MQYTEEQIKDIKERTDKAVEVLKELQLQPACFVQKISLGDDMFADKVMAYLQDTKFNEPPQKTE